MCSDIRTCFVSWLSSKWVTAGTEVSVLEDKPSASREQGVFCDSSPGSSACGWATARWVADVFINDNDDDDARYFGCLLRVSKELHNFKMMD